MTRQPFPKLLRPFVSLLLGIAIINLMATAGRAGDDQKTFKKQPYPGSLDREYIVHVPDNIDRLPKPVPLVVVLHGCKQDHKTIQHDTNFDAVADQEGFITLYPYITDTSRQNACWGWWMNEEIHKPKGEVEDLCLLIKEVQGAYPINKERTHITGVSAGGGMAVDVMMAHPELIASGATTAGLPYSETASAVSFVCSNPGSFKTVDQLVSEMDAEMGSGKKFIPIYIVHSSADCMLKIKSSENIRDAWGKAFEIDTTHPVASESGETLGTPWTHATYGDQGKRIETLFLDKLPHGWYGGRADGEYSYPNAPNTALLMWKFFKSFYPPSLTVSITNAAADQANHIVRVEGRVTDDGPLDRVTVKVELLGKSHQDAREAPVNPANGTFVFTSESGLPDNTYYRPLVTAKDAGNEQVTALGSPVALGTPSDKPPVVTIDNVAVDKDCADLTGTARDDAGLDSVDVRIDGKNWMPAVINHETWTYKVCGLAPGKHEVAVRAMNKAALDWCTSTSINIPKPPVAQSSDLVAHMVASRVREYPEGFGSADKSFMGLYSEHGMNNPFFLYEAPGTKDWYADTGNIPKVGGAMAPTGVAVPLEGVKRPRAMQRTSERDLKRVPCPCP